MKIVVLAGGLSPERDVSLSSGALISNALIECGHSVMLLDLLFGEKSVDFKPIYRNSDSNYKYEYHIPEKEPDLKQLESEANGNTIDSSVIDICKAADKVFLALHGAAGENGQVQSLFDLHKISYTGTGYVGSLLAMDKDISKRLMRDSNILTADWQLVDLKSGMTPKNTAFPCVVKPCACGSSVGVTIVDNEKQFKSALDFAGKYEDLAIVESKIEGREFSVGILNGRALPPIEIKPLSGWYDYKNKYQAGQTKEICPADISSEVDSLLRSSALSVHKALRLGFYSRVDFILDKNNNAYCLEANTLPGMTPTSLLPQEAAAEGITYNELCDMIAKG